MRRTSYEGPTLNVFRIKTGYSYNDWIASFVGVERQKKLVSESLENMIANIQNCNKRQFAQAYTWTNYFSN